MRKTTEHRPAEVQPAFWVRQLAPRLTMLATMALAYLQNGGSLPKTAEGWCIGILIVVLVVVDGATTIQGARKVPR